MRRVVVTQHARMKPFVLRALPVAAASAVHLVKPVADSPVFNVRTINFASMCPTTGVILPEVAVTVLGNVLIFAIPLNADRCWIERFALGQVKSPRIV